MWKLVMEKLTGSTKQVFFRGSVSTAFVHDCRSQVLEYPVTLARNLKKIPLGKKTSTKF